ncbi:hypothetical protein HMPREF1531_01590 [Propionibacterium sp. oral taxon 192 str. F0372]|uniref:UTP--glucose-1-phosphate uridylyltransferase n=1 Tax=Propionibacterium sp. oral taxon 192 TaxID=671222 RepID=UPI000353199D|nr:UTP--glucose-1-phosphate uridylyltransferase [Propionibacterium sp. oral taxon 192]EPH02284.1 hypothetical protein HMPREF1531_01590 [Propionibacterium sp. oral taxon 192 str. F0372]
MSEQALEANVATLKADGAAPSVIAAFVDRFQRLTGGDSGFIAESEITPVTDLPNFDDTILDDAAVEALSATAVIRLNGGLGTSMGLASPKCLIPVRDGRSFLDIVVGQVMALRRETGARLPLTLMHSYNTSEATMAALKDYPGLMVDGIPLEFLQSRQPKIEASSRMPVAWPANPEMQWCPPGHGDFYPSMLAAGLLDTLLNMGFRQLFVANSDNLGAIPEARLAGWFAASGAPFAMEVTARTIMDRKGGHLAARAADGRLVLRESTQVSPEETDSFMDITKHGWMNTNNLWMNLQALKQILDANQGTVPLPLIVNRKTVDPADSSTPAVIHLECALGAAIEVFDGATAITVPRSRFLPVKSTAELALLRSDVYKFADDDRLVARSNAPIVALDQKHYRVINDFEARFPHGVPSLVEASSFTVEGDWTFGRGIVAHGAAHLGDPGKPSLVPDGVTVDENGIS